jgi:GNAT superfamily N-acetyltransferase
MEIYADARDFMRDNGNPCQWINGYPDENTVMRDIESGSLYALFEDGEMLAVFYFSLAPEPTYESIDGAWLSDAPCGTIHRIAVARGAHGRGLASLCFDFCRGIMPHLRIDTHRDNLPMQRTLAKYGFTYCGIIHLANGSERMAYELLR